MFLSLPSYIFSENIYGKSSDGIPSSKLKNNLDYQGTDTIDLYDDNQVPYVSTIKDGTARQ